MKKKIIASILLAGILAVSACGNNNKPAESTTTTAATAAAATTENNTTDAKEDVPGDTLIEAGVECSFEAAMNATKAVMAGGDYTYDMIADVSYQDQSMAMKTYMVKSAELGTYSDVDMGFMKSKTICYNDGKIVIINDDKKTYVITNQEESGMTSETNVDTGIVPIKEPINTADLVQFENGNKRAYRFLITPENNANDGVTDNIYVYVDVDTLIICGMYGVQNGSTTRMYLTLTGSADSTCFNIPEGYTEITMEQYQQQLMSGLNITIPAAGENE